VATTTRQGVVDTGVQSFAGAKTFTGDVTVPKLIIGSYYLNSLIANNKVPDSCKVDNIEGAEILQRDGSVPLTGSWNTGQRLKVPFIYSTDGGNIALGEVTGLLRILYESGEVAKLLGVSNTVATLLLKGIKIGAFELNSLIANNKVPDSDKVDGEHASAIVTKARVDAIGTDHAQLSNVLSGQHHAQLHGSSHHSGGGDAVKLDDLASPDDNVDLNASITKHGLLKKLGGGTTNFLRADGAWATPAGISHASEHEVGGGDLVSHDSLTDFLSAEHLSLPNTIANVLSNHTLAVHNALDITQLGTISSGIWQGTAIGWAYISKTGSNLTDLVTRLHSSLQSIGVDDHHDQVHTLASHTSKDHHLLAGLGDDDHSIYYNAARHTKAVHDALTIDHGSLDGKGDDDHSIYYNAARHTKAIHDALLITVLGIGALAKDHGTPATDMLVNVCYGTGAPPTADTTTIGTIFIRYTA